MVLDLLIRLIEEAQKRHQQARQEDARRAAAAQGIPMAMPVAGEPKKKKKKKRKQAEEPREGPAPRRSPEPASPVPAVEAERPDLARMFVLSEILGPPAALRDDD